MKWIWLTLVCVVLAGAVAAFLPSSRNETPSIPPQVTPREPAAAPRQAPATPAPQATPSKPSATPPANASARMERQPDGSLLLDGRFTVTGSGSEQDPFTVSWSLLASASESIDPAAGRMDPPPHIAFLNGQWVQISGFLAPPLWGEQTTELLVMKNRWDGCCIGLPPTPFDCIEATLAEPIKLGAKHSISFGTVRGRLAVEPFKAGAFLIGLYRLEGVRVAEMKGS